MAGSPPTQTIGQTPSMRPPGFQFAQQFLNSLLPMVNSTPFPQYGGSLDPGLSPSMQNYLRMAQGYSGMAAPPVLQGAGAALSNMMDPSFLSPASQLAGGFPDYFGQDPNQTVFGGGTLGQLAPGGFNVPGYGGAPAGGMGGMPPGMDPSSLMGALGGKMGGAQMTPGGGAQAGDRWRQAPESLAERGPGAATPGAASIAAQGTSGSAAPPNYMQGINYTPGKDQWTQADADQYTKNVIQAQYGGAGGTAGFGSGGGNAVLSGAGLSDPMAASGVQTAWNMGPGANRGQTRIDPVTGQQQIYMGTGGGENFSWQAFDPSNYGQVQSAEMFGRYGPNWTSGGAGGQFSGHTALQPGQNQVNVYDKYYGVH